MVRHETGCVRWKVSTVSRSCPVRDSGSARWWLEVLPMAQLGSGVTPLPLVAWVRRMLSPNAPPSPTATTKRSSPRRRPSSIRSPRPAARPAATSTADSRRRCRAIRYLSVPVPERGCVEPTWTDAGHLPVTGYTPSTGRRPRGHASIACSGACRCSHFRAAASLKPRDRRRSRVPVRIARLRSRSCR